LVGHVVNSERDVLEHVVVISRAHGRRKTVFKLIEVQIGVRFLYYSHKLFEIFLRYKSQRCSCVYNELINVCLEGNSAILHITHRQSPVVRVEKVVPEKIPSRMFLQIKASNHNFRLLKVFADCKGKHVLVDLPLIVELLNKERSTFAARNWSKTHNSIRGHS